MGHLIAYFKGILVGKITGYKESIKNLKIIDRQRRLILGRNGLSWSKIGLFYGLHFALLGLFFYSLVLIFLTTLPTSRPRYYNRESTMASRNRINPGLGFRPQVDIGNTLIDSSEIEKLVRNLKIYLRHYYDERNETAHEITDCAGRDLDQLRVEMRERKAHCAFDYKSMLRGTDCDPENDFGYATSGPCVLVKLNRIYGWTPTSYQSTLDLPLNSSLINVNESVLESNILVHCDGEYGSDRDAISQANLTYYSVNSNELSISKVGLLPFYYYPYLSQSNYKSPLVFLKFNNLPENRLINVICRAYARNIDSTDKLYLRGMTLFQVYAGRISQ